MNEGLKSVLRHHLEEPTVLFISGYANDQLSTCPSHFSGSLKSGHYVFFNNHYRGGTCKFHAQSGSKSSRVCPRISHDQELPSEYQH